MNYLRAHCAVLALASSLLTVPAVVQAQFEFVTNNGTITITRYTGPGGDVTVPRTINGLPVTTIGFVVAMYPLGAFERCTSLTSVVIPNSITSIINNAFAECTSLDAIYFMGDAPSAPFWLYHVPQTAVFYYLPWTSGWGPTFSGRRTEPWNPVEQLIIMVDDSGIAKPAPLLATLSASHACIDRGNFDAAANQLRAFQNKVRAQVADEALAREFIEAAQQVIEAL